MILSLLNMHVQSFQMIFNIFSILRERYQIKFDFDDGFLFSNGKCCKMIDDSINVNKLLLPLSGPSVI